MVPIRNIEIIVSEGFPHARGDGPCKDYAEKRINKFSPRPWGWSRRDSIPESCRQVFPTPVGMVPQSGVRTGGVRRFPHARGDGPDTTTDSNKRLAFSPRPWGWSAMMLILFLAFAVFPTPVGMVPAETSRFTEPMGFPHARGDGPHRFVSLNCCTVFSPRPWGWSPGRDKYRMAVDVFPTPVGMVRRRHHGGCTIHSFPHARGDGPTTDGESGWWDEFSPRPWGWSLKSQHLYRPVAVFPTPVGMVRSSLGVADVRRGFPHARGDGPLICTGRA